MTREEHRGFEDIVKETKGIVLSAIERHLYARFYHAIDDVAQETYLRAYRSLMKKGFRGDAKIESWLYSIARNESLRMNERLLREQKKFEKSIDELYDSHVVNEEPYDLSLDELFDAIARLPEKYRDVMELLSSGFSEREISEKLQIKKGTVKSRASRGREMLFQIMQEV